MKALWTSIRFLIEAARRLVDAVVLLLVGALFVLFVLQFKHPEKWDTLALVTKLHAYGDPLLTKVAPWLSLKWPAASSADLARMLPLALAFAAFVARAAFKTGAARAVEQCRQIEKSLAKRRRAVAASAQPADPTRVLEPPRPAAVLATAAGPKATRMAEAPDAVPLSKFLEGPPPEAEPEPAPRPAARSAPAAKPPIEGVDTMLGGAPTLQGGARTVSGAPAGSSPRLAGSGRLEARGIPERIGRYEILEELGRGAMGVVYKAKDPQIGRTVAIKTILSATLSEEALETYKQRFYREAQAAGQMSHPGIVAVHDITEDESGQPMMVMEFVEGVTLEKMIAGERLPLGQAVDLIVQVADALDYAHGRGVIHRDIKPANVLVTPQGRVKITDFGIAKMAGVKLTQTGQLIGTPAFMSPEQFMGSAVDSRSDLFSLGSIFYWLCTGEKPFPGETVTAIAYKVVQTAPVPARQLNPALPADIDVILSRCLAKGPEGRYATAHLLAADLEAFKAGRPVAASQMSPIEAQRPRE